MKKYSYGAWQGPGSGLTWNLNSLKTGGGLVSPVTSYTNLPHWVSSKMTQQTWFSSMKGRKAARSVSSAFA